VIQVDSFRFDGHGRDIFDPDWEKLHVTYVYPNSELTPPKPELLGEMLEVAEALSRGADFVRVDLYVTTKGIKFGELTNYPEGGMGMFEPASFDTWLGKDWHPHY
jgi:hypothetical protein